MTQWGEVRHLHRTAERVDWSQNVNCIQMSAEATERAWRQLVADAPELKRQAGGSSRGRLLEKPYAQYVLSWHPDDKPSREHMLETVQEAMKAIGLGHCQYRIVAHRDTKHVPGPPRARPRHGPVERRRPPPEMEPRVRETAGPDPDPGPPRRPHQASPPRAPETGRSDAGPTNRRREGAAPRAPPPPEHQRPARSARHAHRYRAPGMGRPTTRRQGHPRRQGRPQAWTDPPPRRHCTGAP